MLEDSRGKCKAEEQLTDFEKVQRSLRKTYLVSLPKTKIVYLIREQKIKDYSLI